LIIYEKFEQLLEQPDLIRKIDGEIQRLGLSTAATSSRSALSLLNEAEQAFRVPSVNEVSPSAVPIPVREAIKRIFDDLLPRRPQQEKTGGN